MFAAMCLLAAVCLLAAHLLEVLVVLILSEQVQLNGGGHLHAAHKATSTQATVIKPCDEPMQHEQCM
jgi:hypothetical protein